MPGAVAVNTEDVFLSLSALSSSSSSSSQDRNTSAGDPPATSFVSSSFALLLSSALGTSCKGNEGGKVLLSASGEEALPTENVAPSSFNTEDSNSLVSPPSSFGLGVWSLSYSLRL